jgi:hypothetical protein
MCVMVGNQRGVKGADDLSPFAICGYQPRATPRPARFQTVAPKIFRIPAKYSPRVRRLANRA